MRVGLTGGIASGKSLVSTTLSDLGAVVIDNDLLARRVVEPGSLGLDMVVKRFGPGVLTRQGTLDRKRLGAIVFDDPSSLADLNAIIHPLIRQASAQIENRAPEQAVVVHDIPLLVESGQAGDFDLVVVVDVPPQTQLTRLLQRDALDIASASARIAAQITRQARLDVADVVIDNSGSRQNTVDQVDSLWRRLTSPGETHPA